MWTMTLWNTDMPLIQWGVVIGASLVAATFDVAARRIPNRLTGPMLLTGLAWAIYSGGLAVPFLIAGWSIEYFFEAFHRIKHYFRAFEIVSGLMEGDRISLVRPEGAQLPELGEPGRVVTEAPAEAAR